MKICKRCKTENDNSASLCSKCFARLDETENVQADGGYAEEYFKRAERREKIIKALEWAAVPLYYVIFAVIGFCRRNDGFGLDTNMWLALTVVPVVYILLMFCGEGLFRISHIFSIDNIDEVNVSEWYQISCKISAIAVLAVGLWAAACHVPATAGYVADYIMTHSSTETAEEKYPFEETVPTDAALAEWGAVIIGENDGEAKTRFADFAYSVNGGAHDILVFKMDGVVYTLDNRGEELLFYADSTDKDGIRSVTEQEARLEVHGDGEYRVVNGGGETLLAVKPD